MRAREGALGRRRGRAQGVAAVLLLVVTLVGGRTAGGSGVAPAVLDLAAMTLVPPDVPEEGFGLAGARGVPIEEDAERIARARGAWRVAAAAEVRERLRRAGWRGRYETELVAVDGATPGRRGATVLSAVTEYGDAPGAAAAFALLGEGGLAAAGRPARGLIPLGDESRIVRTVVAGSGAGATVPRLALTLRRENVIGVVDIGDESGERGWGVLAVERLGAALLARIVAVRAGGAPALAPRLLRVGPGWAPAPAPAFDAYDRLGGETFDLYGVDPADAADRQRLYGTATDVYTYEQALADDREAPVSYAVKLYRFPDAGAAAAWLEGAPGMLFDDPGSFLDLALVEGAATVGQASRTVSYAFPATEEATTRGFRIYARVGNEVARVQLDAVPEVPLGTVEAFARAQVGCLAAPACEAPPPVPWERLVPATPAVP